MAQKWGSQSATTGTDLSAGMAEIEGRYIEPSATIESSDITKDKDTGIARITADRAVVKLVIDNAQMADTYINIMQWSSGWTLIDTLYQSPQAATAFDGGNVAQANVPKFTLSNTVSTITPKLIEGIFYEDPPMELRPMPGEDPAIIFSKKAIFTEQLNDMKFRQECEASLEQMALFGTCIMKWGFCEYEKTEKKRIRKSERSQIPGPNGPFFVDTDASKQFNIIKQTRTVARPWIKFCDIRTVLVDPGCRMGDVRRSKWVIYRDYCTYDDLDLLRQTPGYNIPSETAMRALFLSAPTSPADNIAITIPEQMFGYLQHALPRNKKTSADPLQAPLEILEYWTKDQIVVVLHCNGHNLLLRNEENPYGKIPFYSANWRNIPDSFWGQGLGLLIGYEQLVEQGVTNLALDLLAYCLQPTALRKKGFNTPTQNVRWKQGGIIEVDEDVDKAFKFLEMPSVPSEAWQFIQQAKADAAGSSGANEQVVQGVSASGARSTGMRTATGANAVIAANASRLDGPINRFMTQIFEPWLYQMEEMNNDWLPTDCIHDMLGDKIGADYLKHQIDHEVYRNAKFEFEVLAGSHLGAKREMAQFLPIIMNLLNTPTFVTNVMDGHYMFDGPAIFKAFADAAGWKFSQNFLRPMTADEIKIYEGNKPAAIQQKQQQAQQQAQTQKYQQDQQAEDQKQLGKAASEILRQATAHDMEMESTGEPSNQGFGSETTL
jgi:hypothetical protein